MKGKFKPGQKSKWSGQYVVVGQRGACYGETTMVKGKRFPPTPRKNQTYSLVDATKNGAGK